MATRSGLAITSTIREVATCARIVWAGPSNGITGDHVWTFEQTGEQVTVHTVESWSGAPADTAADQLRPALHQSLQTWLAALKNRAEQHA